MKMKQKRTGYLILAASTAMLIPFSSQAVEFTISGQINRLLMSVDNGVDDGIVHADNSVSGTRWRIKGKGDVGNGMTVGMYYENQLQSNPSSKVSVNTSHLDSGGGPDPINTLDSDGAGGDVGGGDHFSVRHANVWFKGDFGKITLGQGNGAANGSTEADKSGTDVVQYAGSSADLLSSMEYGTSGVTVGAARSSFDGLSRNDNIRYDGGSGPFGFAVSLGNGDKTEVGIKYKTGDLEIRAAVWDKADSGADVAGNAVSVSWMGDGGLNLTGAIGGDDSGADPSNTYLKVGYKMGKHAYAVDWSQTSDKAGDGIDASAFSLAWVNNMMKGVQTYVSYRAESLDDVAGEDDVTALIAGARVKF